MRFERYLFACYFIKSAAGESSTFNYLLFRFSAYVITCKFTKESFFIKRHAIYKISWFLPQNTIVI
jgi:hypothetical protein